MTTLDMLGTASPDLDEASDAALERLDVAVHHRSLTQEYRDKRRLWEES